MVSQGSVLNSTSLTTNVVEKTEALRRACNGIPFFHIYGYLCGVLVPLLFGTTNVFPFYFPETLSAIKAIEKYKCNTYRGTPTQFVDLLTHPERNKHDLSSLKNAMVAGSTVSSDLVDRLKNELNIEDIFIAYGWRTFYII